MRPRAGCRSRTTGEFDHMFRRRSRRYYSNIDYGDFQPRVGIAYQIDDKTVIRAGAGKYTTRLGVSDSVFLGGNPPLQPLASVPNGSVDNPGGGSLASFPLSVSTQAKDFHMPQAYNVELHGGARNRRAIPCSAPAMWAAAAIYGQREKNINQPRDRYRAGQPGREHQRAASVQRLRPDPRNLQRRQLDVQRPAARTEPPVQATVSAMASPTRYSKCMDGGSNQRDVIPDAYDASFLWGPCDYDARTCWSINWIYQLPFFRKSSSKAASALAGGWQITGVTPVPDRAAVQDPDQ